MRIIVLFVAAIAVTQCDGAVVGTQIKGFFAPEDGRKNDDGRIQKIETKPNGYDQNFGHSVLKMNPERQIGTTLLESGMARTGRQFQKTFKEIESGTRPKRQVLRDHRHPITTWQDGVFYMFNTSDVLVQRLFKMGAKRWSESTCIDFMENRNAMDKLVVTKGQESISSVGRCGGGQPLVIGENYLTVWSALHEIGHALGLYHTMQRYDRDSYITLIMENLYPDYLSEFRKTNLSYASVYGLTYDYGSIMHYAQLSASANGLPTMVAIEPHYQETMGSEIISFSDIFIINEHYGCNTKCSKTTSAKCANEGYPHPRNCSTCICPGGYGGALCDRRPPGCGEDLVATREPQTVVFELGYGVDLREEFSFCNYMITASGGKKIAVEVLSVSHGYNVAGCKRGGIEIKAQKNQKLTGYRFCSTMGSEGTIMSSSNRLPVIMFNRFGKIRGAFTYRLVY